MATTLGAEKKGSDLTKQEEKMTNAPVRTAASEPGNTSQHTTETKKVELNKLCSNTVYIFNKTPAKAFTPPAGIENGHKARQGCN